MARPTSRPKPETGKAVLALRKSLGESQQAFANRLGIALQTVARWETKGLPIDARTAFELAELADKLGKSEISKQILSAHLARWNRDFRPTLAPHARHSVEMNLQKIEAICQDIRNWFAPESLPGKLDVAVSEILDAADALRILTLRGFTAAKKKIVEGERP
ncbi:MAG: helix-turn-helix domain-containing protein [Bryobacteraceae bacterium]